MPDPIYVSVCEAKPNKMFTPEETAFIRFLLYSQKVPCAECGKKKKKHWTMLCEFHACSAVGFVMQKGKRLMPLAPVCADHCLAPAFDEEPAPEPAADEEPAADKT